MNILFAERIILITALIIFCFQDIRKKEIYTVGIVIFYLAIVILMIYKAAFGISIDYKSVILGILSGAILLPLGKINILGEGDAFVYICAYSLCVLYDEKKKDKGNKGGNASVYNRGKLYPVVLRMKESLRGSFTIEMTYIIFFVFLGIAFIIGYGIDKHNQVVDNVELHMLLERLSHDEKDMGYDKERLKSLVNLKEKEAVRIEEKKFFIDAESGEKSMRVSIYNPEGYIRATTALEGIYERLKGQLSKEPKE